MVDFVLIDQRPPVLPHVVRRRVEVPVGVEAPRLRVGETRRRWRDIGHVGVFAQHRYRIDSDALDTAVEPEHQHAVEVVDDVLVVPVEVGLTWREGVLVPLSG